MKKCTDACFYIDVDDTLLTWTGTEYSVSQDIVQQIKRAYARQQSVIIWSAGGQRWAQEAAEIAGISHLCYDFLPKPRWYMDDSNPLVNSIKVPFKNSKGEWV